PGLSSNKPEPPSYCPTRMHPDLAEKAWQKLRSEVAEFTFKSSIVENAAYLKDRPGEMHLPVINLTTRLEELIYVAALMNYRKLGIAFCEQLRKEAQTLTSILENKGFDVVSVSCKVGAVPKESVGLEAEQKLGGTGTSETTCSGIIQACILNNENVDFAVLLGLCVGQDALYFKYADHLTTVLVVADRTFGHNPVQGLYASQGYYNRLTDKSYLAEVLAKMPK
ncbi:DUF1847 domain-containing protein, partial [Chloroflexota bacterium]